MGWPAVVALGISALSSWYGSQKQQEAMEEATKSREEMAEERMEMMRDMYERRTELQEPYREMGYAGLPLMQSLATGQKPELTAAQRDKLATLQEKKERAGEPTGEAGHVAGYEPPEQIEVPTWSYEGVKYEKKDWEDVSEERKKEWLKERGKWTENRKAPGLTEEEQQRLEELKRTKQRFEEWEPKSAQDFMGPEQREQYASLKEMARSPLSGVREEINQELAGRGMTQSTPGMSNLAQGMSRERYNRIGNLYNMAQGVRQNRFNRLGQMANIGQGAAAQTSAAAGQFGRSMGNIYGQLGQARARNALRRGNMQARMWGQMGSLPMRGMQTYMYGKQAGVFGDTTGGASNMYGHPSMGMG